MENLRFIRQTMERAGSLTAFPGWGQVVIGVTALIATALAVRARDPDRWLTIWVVEATLSIAIGAPRPGEAPAPRQAFAVDELVRFPD